MVALQPAGRGVHQTPRHPAVPAREDTQERQPIGSRADSTVRQPATTVAIHRGHVKPVQADPQRGIADRGHGNAPPLLSGLVRWGQPRDKRGAGV